jgi:hypothetical protein
MFREISTLIEALTGFKLGAKLQMGHLTQNAPEQFVLIQETGGRPDFYPNEDMADLTIQIFNQAPSYMAAHNDAWDVYKALHGTSGWNLPRMDGSGEDYLVATIEAIACPQYLGEDDNKKHMFSTNYIFRIQEGSCPESGT